MLFPFRFSFFCAHTIAIEWNGGMAGVFVVYGDGCQSFDVWTMDDEITQKEKAKKKQNWMMSIYEECRRNPQKNC